MLHSLHIEHYILIDSLDVQFPEGLVIITGQTGAGKSILLGARLARDNDKTLRKSDIQSVYQYVVPDM